MKLSEAIEKIRPTIVQIAFIANNLSNELQEIYGIKNINKSIGTGFFVSRRGYIITAYHVIKEGLERLKKFQAERKLLKIGIRL